MLVAELDHADARLDEFPNEPCETRRRISRVDQHTQRDTGQPLAAGAADVDHLLQRVEPVADDLASASKLPVDQLAVLFEAPQRLLAPLETGETHVERVGPPAFRRGRNLRADVGRRVARREPFGGGNHHSRPCQLVPQRLRLASQKRIVEREPHVVLDDAQPLTGTIQLSVDDSENCALHIQFLSE